MVEDAGSWLDPLARVGEGAIGFDGAYDAVRGDGAFVGALDNVFEGAAHVFASAGVEAGGVGVIVDGGAVFEKEAAVDAGGAEPVEEHLLDLFAVGVVADGAFALVTGRGCFGFWCGNAIFLGGGGCHRILLGDSIFRELEARGLRTWVPGYPMEK
ncbi:MAG: hypothetical protein ACYC92_02850 [Candidatus Acidiferrales bacterium]